MIDNKCWMIDNLKYIDTSIVNVDGTFGTVFRNGSGPNGSASSPVGTGTTYNTVSGSNTQNTNNGDKAFYNNPAGNSNCFGGYTIVMAANTTTYCGFFYNWYAATKGTGTYNFNTTGDQASGHICPTNFRLPSGSSGTGGPTTNGIVYTHADFPVLSASMYNGVPSAGGNSSMINGPSNWFPSGAWHGTRPGERWEAGSVNDGGPGSYYWSSTNSGSTFAAYLFFNTSDTLYPGDNIRRQYVGMAVRCLLEAPSP